MAKDLELVTDQIRERTGLSKFYYVGHSMGSTIFFIYCSMKPEKCKEHVKVMFSFAPVAFLSHISGFLKFFVSYTDTLKVRLI